MDRLLNTTAFMRLCVDKNKENEKNDAVKISSLITVTDVWE